MSTLEMRVLGTSSDHLVFISGEFDIAGEDEVRKVLEGLSGRVVIDLGGLRFIDGYAAMVLSTLQESAQYRGDRIVLCGATGPVARVLKCLGIDCLAGSD